MSPNLSVSSFQRSFPLSCVHSIPPSLGDFCELRLLFSTPFFSSSRTMKSPHLWVDCITMLRPQCYTLGGPLITSQGIQRRWKGNDNGNLSCGEAEWLKELVLRNLEKKKCHAHWRGGSKCVLSSSKPLNGSLCGIWRR